MTARAKQSHVNRGSSWSSSASRSSLVILDATIVNAFLPFTAGIIIGAAASQQLIARLGAREVPLIGLVIAVVLFALLRRGDVLAVAHGEEAPVVT